MILAPGVFGGGRFIEEEPGHLERLYREDRPHAVALYGRRLGKEEPAEKLIVEPRGRESTYAVSRALEMYAEPGFDGRHRPREEDL